MAMNDYEELVRVALEGWSSEVGPEVRMAGLVQTAEPVLIAPLDSAAETTQAPTAAKPVELGRLAQEMEQIRRLTTIQVETVKQSTATSIQNSGARKEDSDGSVARTILNTAGMVTGVGPIVAGLMAIFGGKKEEETAPFQSFQLPRSVAVDAGLSPNGSFTDIQYAQNGLARPASSTRASSSSPREAATVHINVQALDTRSFLDHSDEIARAVREAMLHSHSLNDVVAEL